MAPILVDTNFRSKNQFRCQKPNANKQRRKRYF